MRRFAVVLLVLVAGGCSDPLQLADWTSPPAEGVRILEYPYTPAADRSESIGLVDDLVLGLDASDPEQAFYGVRDVDADGDGNLYVLDAGNARVKVFDAEGNFVRSFGGEGQGPGEFESASYMTLVGDRVVVRAARSRLAIFDLQGNHVTDAVFEGINASVSNYSPRPDGTFLASYSVTDRTAIEQGVSGPVETTFTVAAFDLDGNEIGRHVQVPAESFIVFSGATQRPASVARPFPSYGASPRGDVYVTDGREYQVHAFDPDAEPKWAMRVAYTPAGIDDAIVARALEVARRRTPEATESDLIWPDRLPALSHVAVDGHGHVYVYPHFERGEELEERPVDVYSPEGELLFSGMILDRRWRRGHGDFVYAAGSDRVTGELLVWRWKLEEPF